MNKNRYLLCLILISLVSYPLVAFCDPGYFRTSPQAAERVKATKTLGILFIDMKVYELTAGGMHELKEDWTGSARHNFSTSLQTELKDRLIEAKVLDGENPSEEMDDVQVLYKAVRSAILTHTYGSALNWDFFPEKLDHFDYSLGPIEGLLARLNVDGLILVTAGDEVSTGGRKTLMVVGAFTGVHPRSGMTWADAALVDGSGSILWFSANPGKAYDLREPDDVFRLVGGLFKEFPVPKK